MMAALSRPSLRSSARKSADHELLATDAHLPKPRPGKRTRDSSLDNGSNTSTKKVKQESPTATRPKIIVHSAAHKCLPIRDRPETKDAGTQVVRSRRPDPLHVHLPPNGSTNKATTLNGHSIHTRGALRAQQDASPNQADKRSLRSHDGGSRSKSELAQYFPNYDELVSIQPKKPDYITPETLIHITDESTKGSTSSKIPPNPQKVSGRGRPVLILKSRIPSPLLETMEWGEETFTELNDATRLDYSSLERHSRHSMNDPMDDSVYLKVHRRAERQEKQLRNIEKERAMHEKVQLERLLDGLKGHDWLRVMGISGITDGEKKAFEPKRDYLIGEVQILLEKFRLWKEEEKRRKVEKEEEVEVDEDEEDDNEEEEESEDPLSIIPHPPSSSNGDPPDYTDLDASAARQLHHEAILASSSSTSHPLPFKNNNKTTTTKTNNHHRKPRLLSLLPPAPPPQPEEKPKPKTPFTSFYSKPYLRAAAVNKHRRGRSKTAFGVPLVEMVEREFVLPEEVFEGDEREGGERRRRRRRGGGEGG